jgi:hypothetical protein
MLYHISLKLHVMSHILFMQDVSDSDDTPYHEGVDIFEPTPSSYSPQNKVYSIYSFSLMSLRDYFSVGELFLQLQMMCSLLTHGESRGLLCQP